MQSRNTNSRHVTLRAERDRLRIAAAVIGLTCAVVSLVAAAPAQAQTVDQLKDAVSAARAASSCGPLSNNPTIDQAALEISQSGDSWLDHTARAQPASDALPLLKDLGYQGSKATILYGAGRNAADSIKALVLQGFHDIPDCSYREFGAGVSQGNSDSWILSTVVLAA